LFLFLAIILERAHVSNPAGLSNNRPDDQVKAKSAKAFAVRAGVGATITPTFVFVKVLLLNHHADRFFCLSASEKVSAGRSGRYFQLAVCKQ
jgi:hypothetical protein